MLEINAVSHFVCESLEIARRCLNFAPIKLSAHRHNISVPLTPMASSAERERGKRGREGEARRAFRRRRSDRASEFMHHNSGSPVGQGTKDMLPRSFGQTYPCYSTL